MIGGPPVSTAVLGSEKIDLTHTNISAQCSVCLPELAIITAGAVCWGGARDHPSLSPWGHRQFRQKMPHRLQDNPKIYKVSLMGWYSFFFIALSGSKPSILA